MLFNRKTVPYLIGAQVAALGIAFVFRSPDLSATAQRQDAIRKQTQEEAYSRQEALNRAQSCIPLMAEVPITDGTAAYFSSVVKGRVVIHKNRPMPDGTPVCDSFGNTGVVAFDFQGNPIVTDIRRMPIEEMEQVLRSRGVMPHPTQRKFANN